MRRSIVGGVFAVGVMIAFVVVCLVYLTQERRRYGRPDEVRGGSIALGADTEHIPLEVPAHPVPVEEVPVAETPTEQNQQLAEQNAAPEPWQPDVTIRIRDSRRTLETQLRRFEELRRRVELSYATLAGYRDAIERFSLYSENAESRAVLMWGGRLASQTARLQVEIQDSIDDLQALSTHKPYQQSRLSYVGSRDFDLPKSIDPTQIPRNAQSVYEWFTRYAGTLREVEYEWRESIAPTYTALEEMLAAELERARERREDVLRSPPDKGGASSAEESGSK